MKVVETPFSAAVRAMARRTKGREYTVTPIYITWLRRCISRRFVAAESTRTGPTFPHPSDKDVELALEAKKTDGADIVATDYVMRPILLSI